MTLFPTTRFAVVFKDINCLALSNAVTVPECDVRLSPAVNVPDIFVKIAWRKGVRTGAEENVKHWF